MQKTVFLNDEGDAWFERNHQAIQSRSFNHDEPVIQAIIRSCVAKKDNACGGGLHYLKLAAERANASAG